MLSPSDIYSIGLKTLVADSPDSMGPLIVARATPQLLRGITSPASSDASGDIKVKTQCMEVLLELLKRFGGHMDEFKREIMEAMLRQVGVFVGSANRSATCLSRPCLLVVRCAAAAIRQHSCHPQASHVMPRQPGRGAARLAATEHGGDAVERHCSPAEEWR